eukprot:GHVS01049125.1.p1 GENE.GHVS01049125.1~~GHVS01049125.1.p1  ORF type:complete len:350 (+),score=43.66 GHVS01049125.1:183-1232(+)
MMNTKWFPPFCFWLLFATLASATQKFLFENLNYKITECGGENPVKCVNPFEVDFLSQDEAKSCSDDRVNKFKHKGKNKNDMMKISKINLRSNVTKMDQFDQKVRDKKYVNSALECLEKLMEFSSVVIDVGDKGLYTIVNDKAHISTLMKNINKGQPVKVYVQRPFELGVHFAVETKSADENKRVIFSKAPTGERKRVGSFRDETHLLAQQIAAIAVVDPDDTSSITAFVKHVLDLPMIPVSLHVSGEPQTYNLQMKVATELAESVGVSIGMAQERTSTDGVIAPTNENKSSGRAEAQGAKGDQGSTDGNETGNVHDNAGNITDKTTCKRVEGEDNEEEEEEEEEHDRRA